MKERKEWKDKKYRHVYRYTCGKCGRKRLTLSHERFIAGECTKCEPPFVDPNQGALPL